jgi:putative membrane protein insertion efficiency factor
MTAGIDTGVRAPSPPRLSGPGTTKGPAAWAIKAIHAYQLARSGRPTGCRFLPTCSEYAADAITQRGLARGTFLAAGRLTRCNPWGGHGYDPVPNRRPTCKHP